MKEPLIFAIETSCDETSVAILEGPKKAIYHKISSQIDVHKPFGGVVPEVASRKHLEMVHPMIEEAFQETGLSFHDIDLIGVTKGPGLVGALLVGIAAAKAMAMALDKPLVGVNHMHGHLLANELCHPELPYPHISMIVSGGHTYLVEVKGPMDYALHGKTRDDAAGEAFDKTARLLGLSYPGGPSIQKAAEKGNANRYTLPKVMLEKGSYDFSFSGLKTAVMQLVEKEKEVGNYVMEDVAASFQETVVDTLVKKTELLMKQLGIHDVTLSGGVAANQRLREKMDAMVTQKGGKLYSPSLILSTDNAAMIGTAAYYTYEKHGADDMTMGVYPNLGL